MHTFSTQGKQLFSIMHYNIQGLSRISKVDELNVFFESFSKKPEILCLSEHWLNTNTIHILNQVVGYKVVNCFYRKEMQRGGVCILAMENIEVRPLPDIDKFCREYYFECCGVALNLYKPAIVICLYRSTYFDKLGLDSFFQSLDSLLQYVNGHYSKYLLFLAGDFNINLLEKKGYVNYFVNMLDSYNINIPNHTIPTRVVSCSRSCIDNIYTNLLLDTCKIDIFDNDLSDHTFQILKFENCFNKIPCQIFSHRDFSRSNISHFVTSIDNENWESLWSQNCSNVNILYSIFLSIFKSHFNSCFPVKTIKVNNNVNKIKGWVTPGIIISSKRKRELHLLSKKSNNKNFLNYVKNYKKVFRQCVRKAKLQYNSNLIISATNKTKMAWKVIKSETSSHKKSCQINLLVEKGIPLTRPSKIADTLNKHFLYTTRCLNLSANYTTSDSFLKRINKPVTTLPIFPPVTAKEIESLAKELKSTKSCGWDDIPTFLVKACAKSISQPLAHIINVSFKTGVFPHLLKFSCVTPLFKKGDTSSADNYRPIAILPAFSKLIERAIFNRLQCFLLNSNVIYSKQFGFQKNKSTTHATFELTRHIFEAFDQRQFSAGVFCDLTKAFDCVDHHLLLRKLAFYGLKENAFQLLHSYVINRFQCTVLSNYRSKFQQVVSGVPQGSILGPLLFLLYINDLGSNVRNSNLILYADDTTAILKSSSGEKLKQMLYEAMDDMDSWFLSNGLMLNKEKTVIINFHPNYSKSNRAQAVYAQSLSNLSTSVKFLGVTVDESLTWSDHITQLQCRLNKAFYLLLVLSHSIDLSTLKAVYYAYVYSHLTYGVVLWGNSSDSLKIFRIQKRIVRIMAGANIRSSCRNIFKTFEILPLPCIFILNTIMFVKVNMSFFHSTTKNHSYGTRNKHLLQTPAHKSASFERSVLYMGSKLFNKLPLQIKNISKLPKFKLELKNYLKNKNFYSVNEFLND